MAEVKKETPCSKSEHNFAVVDDSNSHRQIKSDVHVYRTLYCTKCAETREFLAVVWPKTKGKYIAATADPVDDDKPA